MRYARASLKVIVQRSRAVLGCCHSNKEIKMATEVEHLPDFPGSVNTKRLEGTLVAKRAKTIVPNHLADTKIFTEIGRNGMLQCKPNVVHFNGYKVGEVQQQTLRIINASRENQHMHIIPPTTSNFGVKYTKQRSSLVPGLSLEVTVQFRPTEWKYYYDCIRVHWKGDHNLLIPIHAYPVMNTAKFPQSVTFPPTPIGQTRSKTISLRCDVPINFEYELSFLQIHPAFNASPMKGTVSANGQVDVTVTFTPTDFSTACMKLQLELSQFNSSPLVCTFTGSSTPGLTIEQLKKDTQTLDHPLNSTTSHKTRIRPIPPSIQSVSRRRLKHANKTKTGSNTTLPSKVKEDIVYDGIHFPPNMDTPNTVSKVLAQKPGKMKASKLRQVLSTEQKSGLIPTRQMKEAAFLHKVRETASEERANQLRWVTNLGDVPMSDGEREQVLQSRSKQLSTYQQEHNITVQADQIFHRATTKAIYRRTRRQINQIPSYQPEFDPYSNDLWTRRHLAMQRFVQAARKVVIRLRCQARLKRLQLLASDISAGKTIQESLANMSSKDPDIISIVPRLPKTPDHILLSLFPDYKGVQSGDGPEGGSVNDVSKVIGEPAISTEHIKKEIPYIDLKVPQQYKLMGYSSQPLPAQGSYIQPGLSRPLRYGAEDEIDNFSHIPGVDSAFITLITPPPAETSVTATTIPTESDQMKQKSGSKRATSRRGKTSATKTLIADKGTGVEREPCIKEVPIHIQDIEVDPTSIQRELPLVPPQSLFEKGKYQPLHIFNPTPGVTSFVPMMSNSAVTFDHILKPLPAFPTSKHPQVRLDAMEVIPGIMQWKKFPNHSLVAMEGDRKLATVWKPRWTDPFSTELLPAKANGTPEVELLSQAQPDDFVDEKSDGVLPVPTMEMVRAQFHYPGSATQQTEELLIEPSMRDDPRLNARKKLTAEKREKFNQLGEKINQKLEKFQDLLRDKHSTASSL